MSWMNCTSLASSCPSPGKECENIKSFHLGWEGASGGTGIQQVTRECNEGGTVLKGDLRLPPPLPQQSESTHL